MSRLMALPASGLGGAAETIAEADAVGTWSIVAALALASTSDSSDSGSLLLPVLHAARASTRHHAKADLTGPSLAVSSQQARNASDKRRGSRCMRL